jgi:protein O-GlcNAcase / histone acetyltransferase
MGCRHWALLFDDIENDMCEEDRQIFASFADAQVSVTNDLYQYLAKPEIFLFCPTGSSVQIE